MVQKPEIRSWHRDEFNAGKLDNIPPHVVDLLKAEKKGAKLERDEYGKLTAVSKKSAKEDSKPSAPKKPRAPKAPKAKKSVKADKSVATDTTTAAKVETE